MKNKKIFVFDLDDTLYKEIDFLNSAYKEIASMIDEKNSRSIHQQMITDYHSGKNVFENIHTLYPEYTVEKLLALYRNHFPSIQLTDEDKKVLLSLKQYGSVGLITDGRSITQRNKIKALQLEIYFDKILISEEVGYSKPDQRLFEAFLIDEQAIYFYIANDTSKDFISPNRLGWQTICLLDAGNRNIRKQDFSLKKEYLPKMKIRGFNEILKIIETESFLGKI